MSAFDLAVAGIVSERRRSVLARHVRLVNQRELITEGWEPLLNG